MASIVTSVPVNVFNSISAIVLWASREARAVPSSRMAPTLLGVFTTGAPGGVPFSGTWLDFREVIDKRYDRP